MQNKYYFVFILFLFVINVFAWQEVFALYDNNLKFYFFDVGQGDSAFIKTSENHQIIIDGGPGSAVLEKISKIMPFWDKSIDIVILSHPEKDHMQGLLEILKRYKVDYIIQVGVLRNTDEFRKWQNVLEYQKKLGAKIINVKADDIILVGNSKIEILFPFENLAGKNMEKSSNEVCLVARLDYGENSFLFTGDIGEKTEKEMILNEKNIECDVLKVAHHGSKYSTSELFLENTNSDFAVIGVGKNSYGHPTSEVLQRLQNYDIKILRTDENKNIIFSSDGKNLIIKN